MDKQFGLPDFFIIGAAKCGTTDLASLLQHHPSVFVPDEKEPCYFSRDEMHLHTEFFLNYVNPWATIDWDTHLDAHLRQYGRLFENVPDGALRGEATTEYFLPQGALRIREMIPNAKLILMLREPMKRVMATTGSTSSSRGVSA